MEHVCNLGNYYPQSRTIEYLGTKDIIIRQQMKRRKEGKRFFMIFMITFRREKNISYMYVLKRFIRVEKCKNLEPET